MLSNGLLYLALDEMTYFFGILELCEIHFSSRLRWHDENRRIEARQLDEGIDDPLVDAPN